MEEVMQLAEHLQSVVILDSGEEDKPELHYSDPSLRQSLLDWRVLRGCIVELYYLISAALLNHSLVTDFHLVNLLYKSENAISLEVTCRIQPAGAEVRTHPREMLTDFNRLMVKLMQLARCARNPDRIVEQFFATLQLNQDKIVSPNSSEEFWQVLEQLECTRLFTSTSKLLAVSRECCIVNILQQRDAPMGMQYRQLLEQSQQGVSLDNQLLFAARAYRILGGAVQQLEQQASVLKVELPYSETERGAIQSTLNETQCNRNSLSNRSVFQLHFDAKRDCWALHLILGIKVTLDNIDLLIYAAITLNAHLPFRIVLIQQQPKRIELVHSQVGRPRHIRQFGVSLMRATDELLVGRIVLEQALDRHTAGRMASTKLDMLAKQFDHYWRLIGSLDYSLEGSTSNCDQQLKASVRPYLIQAELY